MNETYPRGRRRLG